MNSTEIHIVVLFVIALVMLLNSIPAAGLVLYFAIPTAIMYVTGTLETDEDTSHG